MYDLLLKNAVVLDGTGRAPFPADVAVADGRIAAVEPQIDSPARETIDVAGKLLTPGFIDIHTHYDGQVTWDSDLLPTSAHGVTTIVLGSCGIGFAPVRKGSEDWLITITEGVEDIPGTALHVGIPWGWESYTDYLDFLDRGKYSVDVAAHVPHSSVRAYVLGRRAETDERATREDLAEMARIVKESIEAGAVGFGTSRVTMHRGSDGGILPGTTAAEDELLAMAQAMKDGGGGVLQIIPSGITGGVEGQDGEQTMAGLSAVRDKHTITAEIEMMRRLHVATGLPVTFTFAESIALGDAEYERARGVIAEAHAAGELLYPQYSPRPVGGLITLDAYHPFTARPSYISIAELPLDERVQRMCDPQVKAAILLEPDRDPGTSDPFKHIHATLQRNLSAIYSLENVDYEPHPSQSVAARAEAEGRDPLELCYDMLLDRDGRAVLIWFSTGYVEGDLRRKEECIADPRYVMGLADGGAHVKFICDASFPTFLLAHWGKNRTRGERMPVELLVRKLTKDAADLYGLDDRGVIEPGRRADLNVIDWDALAIARPRLVQDLPAGAKRYLQDARGYVLTLVNGVATRRDDQATGEYPGRLVRKPRGSGVGAERPAQLARMAAEAAE